VQVVGPGFTTGVSPQVIVSMAFPIVCVKVGFKKTKGIDGRTAALAKRCEPLGFAHWDFFKHRSDQHPHRLLC